jgi:threonine dehydrogenase-like Zn-dependent dehydrogenase
MSREVAIIGCGPAGLLAAHAAVLADYSPVIYSKEANPSPIHPAVYLHQAIPDVSGEADVMTIAKWGSARGYAERVYGDPDRPVSFAFLATGGHDAWPLAPIYKHLWRLYSGAVREAEIGPEEAVALDWSYRTVINTAPASALCHAGHEFPSRPIWIEDGAPAYVRQNTMLYNGFSGFSPDWYRASDCFGVRSTEYAHRRANAREGVKVAGAGTDCDCHSTIIRVGRWAEWTPGVLLHHAFSKASRLFNLMGAS